MVKAKLLARFICEKCGKKQTVKHTLEYRIINGNWVLADQIICKKCGHDNLVVWQLKYSEVVLGVGVR